MTAKGSASPLAAFAADWLGADIRGLHALAVTLYGYLPEITGVTTALNQEVSQLTGGDQGWRGPAASAFTAAWRRDARAVEALALLIGQAADVVDDLAVGLARIEKTLEEEAYVAARYGVTIGADGRPPLPGGPPGDAATASEQHCVNKYWARAYRRAYDRAMADAEQARDQAAGRLRDLYATTAPGREPLLRQVLGGLAGSIAGVTAAAVVQVGLGNLTADPPDDTAGHDHPAGHLWDSLL